MINRYFDMKLSKLAAKFEKKLAYQSTYSILADALKLANQLVDEAEVEEGYEGSKALTDKANQINFSIKVLMDKIYRSGISGAELKSGLDKAKTPALSMGMEAGVPVGVKNKAGELLGVLGKVQVGDVARMRAAPPMDEKTYPSSGAGVAYQKQMEVTPEQKKVVEKVVEEAHPERDFSVPWEKQEELFNK